MRWSAFYSEHLPDTSNLAELPRGDLFVDLHVSEDGEILELVSVPQVLWDSGFVRC